MEAIQEVQFARTPDRAFTKKKKKKEGAGSESGADLPAEKKKGGT